MDERLQRLLASESLEDLNANLEQLQADKESAARKVAFCEQEIALIEAELARRQLAAYWLAHPELTAVAVGDRLLITDDFKANRENYGGIYAWLDTAISVTAIYEIDDEIVCSLTGKIADRDVVGLGSIPLAVASDMRLAYLESKATK